MVPRLQQLLSEIGLHDKRPSQLNCARCKSLVELRAWIGLILPSVLLLDYDRFLKRI